MAGPAICWWIGFLLIGMILISHNVILRHMKDAGCKTQSFDLTINGKFNLPVEYLKIRELSMGGLSAGAPAFAGVGFILLGLMWPG